LQLREEPRLRCAYPCWARFPRASGFPCRARAADIWFWNLEEHGILDGDYLILAPSTVSRPGGLAVACLRTGTTLVEVLTSHGRVRRVDTRTEMKDGYEVLGDVVAVLRSMKELEEEI
jgi:hypothetical protein